jgi:3,4-dihydroxy 2-butanone 4-phosphate synthase/GTP cyclohydrolase II
MHSAVPAQPKGIHPVSSRFSTVEAAVDAIARGQTVIVLDAEDRENEGDFICAAEKVTPEVVNFMITHGRGMLCTPLLPELCRKLDLTPIVAENTAPLGTALTTPIDHRSVRTGITAKERARTILALTEPRSGPDDFVRPGHVHPLVAKEGGVLRRAGHTEATIDLARMAGMQPVGVLCEILNEEGDRANRDQLLAIAGKFGLEIISIEQLIAYRRRNEKLVHRTAEAWLPTPYGNLQVIVYAVDFETTEPVVLKLGDLLSAQAPLIRMHSSCFTGDVLNSLRCDCGDQLRMALQMIGREGAGAVVYLPQEGRGIGLAEKIKAYALQDDGLDTVEANHALGHKADMRDYGIGLQILKDLGLSEVRLLTNNPEKADAFVYGGFDLKVVDQVPILPPITEHNARYLATKRDKMGHLLPDDF